MEKQCGHIAAFRSDYLMLLQNNRLHNAEYTIYLPVVHDKKRNIQERIAFVRTIEYNAFK